MTHKLQLVKGISVYDLANGDHYKTWQYTPATPSITRQQIIDAMQAGTDNYITVTESLQMMIYGSTRTEARQYLNTLEQRMQEAERYATTGQGEGVYIYLQMDGLTTTERSQILSGRFVLDDSAMYRWAANAVEGTLYITRRYYWERSAETQIKLSDFNANAPSLSGQTVYNHTNSGYGNFVDIPTGSITGALPTPARIEMVNPMNATRVYSNIYIANSVVYSQPNTQVSPHLSNMIQGEDNVPTSSGAAETGLTGNSGNAVLAVQFSGVAYPAWQLSANVVQPAAGKTFRLFVRNSFYSNVTGNIIYLQPQLTQNGGFADLNSFQFEKALPTASQNELNEIGALTFGSFPASAALNIQVACRSAANVRLEFDWLQALPADNLRQLIYRGYGVAAGEAIVDNPVNGIAYQLTSLAQQLPVVTQTRRPVLLYPDTTYAQRIYFLLDINGVATPSERLKIRMWYRPRRLTL